MASTALRDRLGVLLGSVVLVSGVAGCGTDEPEDVAASPSPTTSPGPAASTAPTAASPVKVSPVNAGCPADADQLYQRLKAAPAIVDALPSSLTGLKDPTCVDGWAAAQTVVTDADSALVLFRYEPQTGQWTAVNAGTDGVCEGAKVPAAIRAKLGPAC